MNARTLARLAAASSLAACTMPDPDPEPTRDEVLTVKAVPNRNLDLLFVIDDSATMLDKQAAIRAAFPRFIDELAALDGGLPNLHVGVVSSDMGTLGSGSALPGAAIGSLGNGGCAAAGKAGNLLANGAPIDNGGSFLSDVAQGGSRSRNYTGELSAAFGQMASLGGGGCGFEQHLHAMRRALDGNPANNGFVRDGANLAVIIVADEDDCSVTDPGFFGPESPALGPLNSFRCFKFGVECDADQPEAVGVKANCRPRASSTRVDDTAVFRTFLGSVKPDPRQLMLGVLAGAAGPVEVVLKAPPGGGTPVPVLTPSCSFQGPTGSSTTDPAVRLQAVTEGFPGRARFETMCSADVSAPLTALGRTAKKLVGDACLEREVGDALPEPGLQPDCVVVDVAGGRETELLPCGAGGDSCWELVVDAQCTDTAQHLKLKVTRTTAADPEAYTTVRCAL